MSAATMSGSDAVKTNSTAASKQQSKTSGSGKALDGPRKQAASPVDGQSRKQQSPQPKAWQGHNPITQRASAVIANGTEKPLPKLPPSQQQQTKSITESNADKHAHDRALYLLASFTGHDATLTLKDGEQFTGIFSGASFDSNKHQYVLKMVKRTRSPTHQQINGTTELPNEYIGEGEDHTMAFEKHDTVDLSVPDVVPVTAQPTQNGSINSAFRTDTEISGRDPSMPRARELQRWEPGADSDIGMSLEDSGETGWDQFATNERMYGLQGTYDENIYTTQIDRSDPLYRQKEAEAARLAREIEGSAPGNAHVAEERTRDEDRGDGLDEEEKYSGVKREVASNLPKRAAGAYVPPSRRPLTNAPTVPGAPFDPAIISLAKPAPSVALEQTTEQTTAVESSATTTDDQRVAATDTAANGIKTVAGQLTQTPKKPVESTTEEHVRNVHTSFKEFANNEKLRIRMAQDQKRNAQRQEKNVKLNDLKKFAANFKLKSRVPDDLVPILAKDREKQSEIQRKAEDAAKEEEVRADEKEKEKAIGAASPTPSSTASQAGTADRGVFQSQQQTRSRVSQNLRTAFMPGQTSQTQRQAISVQQNRAYGAVPGFPTRPQPLPENLRIPTGPALPPSAPAADVGPLSPTSQSRHLNAKAFEFRPAASAFAPSGTSPSPQRGQGGMEPQPSVPEAAEFFSKDKKSSDLKDVKDFEDSFNPIKRMLREQTEEQKALYAAFGGVPQPYRTTPTWPTESHLMNTSHKDSMPKSQTPSQSSSQMHTPIPSVSQMPHAHQLPPHMQGPLASTPSQRPPYLAPQHHSHQQPYGPGMPQFGPNGSVQSSPRFQPPQMAFNGQMSGMPMPQFAGQQMQGYGMSPSMQYRQMNMPPQGPMMMMGPNQGHGQMPPMQGYPRGPQQYNPQMMGGIPMSNQASGSYMGGPIPQQQSYSPMPPHAQPHLPHMQHGGYPGSPRPHMMQHTASHQGFQPAGPMHMGQPPPFAPSPGGPHPYHLQHRQMSTGGGVYPQVQMTPRQQQAVPLQSSPGMQTHGDEGK